MNNSWQWYVSGILGSIFCTSSNFLREVTLLVSTQSLAWISIDRFAAVVFLMKLGLISTKIHTLALISTCILAGVENIPWVLTSKLVESGSNTFRVVMYRGPVFPNQEAIAAHTGHHGTFVSIVPLFLITVLYSWIAVTLKRQNEALAESAPSLQRHLLKKTKKSYSNGRC